ncbi:hypothetical protein [Shimia aestuarii]|uniref:Uncharacterized protein n=1 Tax=Shimia aestuarii TaxID=254406 RepID=A0A1I4TJ97_9RHOB|nr:hypothetical protein [Shimia aestuarii]SFM76630.1 hypothetical protein SAMN04488042_11715 [Shimia aestuarii]
MKSNTPKPKSPSELKDEVLLSVEEQRGMLLAIIEDFEDHPVEALLSYFDHVGFDIKSVSNVEEFADAWCGFYRIKTGVYDIDRAFEDLARWPPVARAITELALAKCRGLPNDL